MTLKERVESALKLIEQYAGIEGDHHKQWVLTRVAETLEPGFVVRMNDEYEADYGPWNEGVAP